MKRFYLLLACALVAFALLLVTSQADARLRGCASCSGGSCGVAKAKTVTVEKKVTVEKAFDPAKHPRDPATGQFTKRVTVEKSVEVPTRRFFRRGFCCR